MGKFFVNDCNFTMEDNFLDELRNLTWEYPEIFTGIEETTNENVVCSIAVFVCDEDVLVVDVVRIECTALKDPGDWPKIAEFRVESRNDDGGTEIEHWSVQKARV